MFKCLKKKKFKKAFRIVHTFDNNMVKKKKKEKQERQFTFFSGENLRGSTIYKSSGPTEKEEEGE